jgi:hypothetical protein
MDIITQITTAVGDLRQSKLVELNQHHELGERIASQSDARIKLLSSNLGILRSRIYGDVTLPNIFNNYRLFSNQQLAANEIAHISNKHDVEDVLTKIFVSLGLIKGDQFENYFSAVLNAVDSSTMNQEWNELIQFANN